MEGSQPHEFFRNVGPPPQDDDDDDAIQEDETEEIMCKFLSEYNKLSVRERGAYGRRVGFDAGEELGREDLRAADPLGYFVGSIDAVFVIREDDFAGSRNTGRCIVGVIDLFGPVFADTIFSVADR